MRIKEACISLGGWELRYILSDDNAVKQKAFKLAFRGLKVGKTEIIHLLYRVHLERIL